MKKILVIIVLCLLQVNCGLAFLDDITGKINKEGFENLLPLALLGFTAVGNFKVNKDLSSIDEGKNIQFELSLESGALPANLKVKSSLPSLTINNQIEYTESISNSKITLTLTALEDENQSDETGTLEFSATGYTTLTLQVSCKDNDLQRILVSNSPSSLTEGYSGTGKVRLNIKPNANTTVNISSTDTNSLSVSPSSFIFTPTNYATGQTVTFTALEDSNTLSETVAVSFSTSGLTTTSVSIPTVDNDISPIFSVSSPLSINEGGTTTVNVQLNGDPSASKIVLLQSSIPGVISISPSSITFDSTNWNNPTPITITALQDTNATNESITLTAGGVGLTSSNLFVNTVDDETLNFIITGSSQLTEGQTGNLQINLSADPGTNVTVTLTSNSPNVNFTPTSFIFNSSNYSTPKSIAITTNANDGNEDAEFVIFTATATGVPSLTHNLVIIDKDTRIILSNLPSNLTEGGASNFQVRLSGNPGIPVNVSLSTSLPSISLGMTSIPFTNASYGDQTVSITAVEDIDHNSDSPLISIIGSGLTSASGSLKVYDNDTTIIFGGVSSVTEGTSGIITIKLSGNPLDARTITVSSSDTSHLTLSGTSFNFDSTNYGTNQNITLSALQDINVIQETISITAVSSPYIISQSVNITKPEDDTQSLVFTTSNSSVNEGSNINLTLKLAFEPSANTAITITIPSNTGISFASGSFSGTYSNTFTTGNWNSGFTIPVYGLEDVNTIAENITITASAGGSPTDVTLGISSVDNDIQEISIPTTLSLVEGNNSSILVKLLFDPVSPLTITLTLASSSGISFNSGSSVLSTTVSMTTANYSGGVSLNIYALEDSNIASENVTLTASASGVTNKILTVTSVDNDTQSFVFTSATSSVGEGNSIDLNLKLAFQPPADLPFTITIPSNTGISFSSGSFTGSYSNTLTSSNWSSGFTITVYGIQDLNTIAENITITASAGGSPNNATLNISSVDNDTQGILIPSSISINEGGSNSFLVKLSYDPVSPLTVTLTLASNSGISFSSGSSILTTNISMTTTNYSSGVSVSIYALDDVNNSNETVTLTVTASGVTSQTMITSSIDGYPTISSVPNAQALQNTTISGTNFNTSASSNIVTIGGLSATVVSANTNSLVVTLPELIESESVGTHAVTLTTPRGSANSSVYVPFSDYQFVDQLDNLSNVTVNCDATTTATTSSSILSVVSSTNGSGPRCYVAYNFTPTSKVRSFEVTTLAQLDAGCGWIWMSMSGPSNDIRIGRDANPSCPANTGFALNGSGTGFLTYNGGICPGNYYYWTTRYDASQSKVNIWVRKGSDYNVIVGEGVMSGAFNDLNKVLFENQDCGAIRIDSVQVKKCYYNESAVGGGCW